MLMIAPEGRSLTSSERWRAALWFVLLAWCGVGFGALLTMRIRAFPKSGAQLPPSVQDATSVRVGT